MEFEGDQKMRLQDVNVSETAEFNLDIMELQGIVVFVISEGKAKWLHFRIMRRHALSRTKGK